MALTKEDLPIIKKLYLEHLGYTPTMIEFPATDKTLNQDSFTSASLENKSFSGELSQLTEFLKKAAVSINKKSVSLVNNAGDWNTPAQFLLYEFMNWYQHFQVHAGNKHLHYAYAIKNRMNLFKALFLSNQSIGSLGLNSGINDDENKSLECAYKELENYILDPNFYSHFPAVDLPELCDIPANELSEAINDFIETIKTDHAEKLVEINGFLAKLTNQFRAINHGLAQMAYHSQPKQNETLYHISSIKITIEFMQEQIMELLLQESLFDELDDAKNTKAEIDFFIDKGVFLALDIVQWHVENEKGCLKNVTYPKRESKVSEHEIKFTALLEKIKTKAASLKNTDSEAYAAAVKLHKDLNNAYKKWVNCGAQSGDIARFAFECDDAIEKAKPDLQVDTDWDMIFKNVALAIAGLVIFYGIAGLINLATTGNFLFFKKEQPRKPMMQLVCDIEDTITAQQALLSGW